MGCRGLTPPYRILRHSLSSLGPAVGKRAFKALFLQVELCTHFLTSFSFLTLLQGSQVVELSISHSIFNSRIFRESPLLNFVGRNLNTDLTIKNCRLVRHI